MTGQKGAKGPGIRHHLLIWEGWLAAGCFRSSLPLYLRIILQKKAFFFDSTYIGAI